jgi:hypothetical protein
VKTTQLRQSARRSPDKIKPKTLSINAFRNMALLVLPKGKDVDLVAKFAG